MTGSLRAWLTCLVAVVTCLMTSPCQGQTESENNTYVGQDGRMYFRKALLCQYGTLYGVGNFARLSLFYTKRRDVNCCYLESSRNDCCFTIDNDDGTSSLTECQCWQCEPPPSTAAPITTTPTTTTATTTMMTTERKTTMEATTPMPTPATTYDPFYRVCPNIDVDVLSKCDHVGVARLRVKAEGGSDATTICHAFYTNVSLGHGANRLEPLPNQTFTEAFLTTQSCKDIIEANLTAGREVILQFGSSDLIVNAENFTLIDGPDGTAYIQPNDVNSTEFQTAKGCQSISCAYSTHTQYMEVDFGHCFVRTTYHDDDSGSLSDYDLNYIDVVFDLITCDDIPEENGLRETQDVGAPVICKSRTYEEMVLVGVVATGRESYTWIASFRAARFFLPLPSVNGFI